MLTYVSAEEPTDTPSLYSSMTSTGDDEKTGTARGLLAAGYIPDNFRPIGDRFAILK